MSPSDERASADLELPSGGDLEPQDAKRLVSLVYEELKSIAQQQLRGERPDHTLQPTALVHEAFLRLNQLRDIKWEDRRRFCGTAAHVMRRVLVDYARGRQAAKRGGDEAVRISLDETIAPWTGRTDVDFIELNDALTELAALNLRHAQVVEMRFFGGLTIEETAAALNVSPATIKTDWVVARAWLKMQMQSDKPK